MGGTLLRRAVLSWSSGKDSAWALHVLRQDPSLEIAGLLTTLNEAFDRVAMHAVRHDLLSLQATVTGLPLIPIHLPWPCPNEEYERRMAAACERMIQDGVEAVAFGDLYLENVREYRIRQLAPTGLAPLFPLWGRDTARLSRDMIAAGLRAILTCVDPRKLPAEFAGREFDLALLEELPAGVDPCGENGEFHTFVYDGPCFRYPIAIRRGEVVERDGFVFADVLPATIE